MGAPVSFFDFTPRGRIVNRFSQDMDESTNNVAFLKQLRRATHFFQKSECGTRQHTADMLVYVDKTVQATAGIRYAHGALEVF